MAYATVSHVAAYNAARGTYNAQTKPSATQVVQYLEEIAGEMDAKLRSLGYTLPVVATSVATSTNDFLRGVNAVGAAWKVEVAAPTSDTEEMYKTMYQSALDMMCAVELDIAKDSAQGYPRSGFTSATPMFTAPNASQVF